MHLKCQSAKEMFKYKANSVTYKSFASIGHFRLLFRLARTDTAGKATTTLS